jgi:replicative superfamily II helicase
MTTEKETIRQLSVIPHPKMSDPLLNSVVSLTLETLHEGNSVLVFCSSRLLTVDTAVPTPLMVILMSENDRRIR